MLKEGIALFGARAFPIKEMVAAMGPVLEGSNGPAREIAMALLVDLAKWIGKAPLNSLLESVRSAQKSDFERLFAERDAADSSKPVPSLWLRKDRPAPGSAEEAALNGGGGAGGGSGKAGGGAADIDSREFIEEVDLTKKIRASDFAKLVAEEKWAEQQKGLQLVIDAIGPAPKIKSGCDVHDVVAACKGFLRQGHVQVQVSALRVLALLADGLRSEFGASVRPVTQSVVIKCKEKRLVPEVQSCLTAILKYCLTFDSIIEDVTEHIKNKKIPAYGRVGLMEFAAQAISDVPERVSNDCLKQLADALVASCEDSDPTVREQCTIALARLAPLVKSRGKNALDSHRVLMALEQSAPRVFKKMQEGPTSAGASATTSGAASSTSSKAAGGGADSDEAPKRPATAPAKASSSVAPKKAASSLSASTTSLAGGGSKKASGGGGAAKEDDDAVEELSMGVEDATSALAALGMEGWENSVQAAMMSAKWQEKVEALENMAKKFAETKLGGQLSAALVVYLNAKTSGFKISNVSILKAVIQTACAAAQNVGEGAKFSKAAAWDLLKNFGDKFGDKKTKEPTEALLLALSEAVSPAFVARRMKVVMDKTKLPLAHQYYLEWLKTAVTEFGASSFPVPFLGLYCQIEMDNKVAQVRTAAVEVMGALYHQLGPRLQSVAIAEDTKPQLRALLDAEFARVGFDPAASAAATRVVKGEAGSEGGGAIPRQDLTSLIDKNVLAELNSVEGKNSWQNRKAAIEAIIAGCERSGHFLEANKATGELLRALKPRLNDTQANLKPMAASAIGHLLASFELDAAVRMLRAIATPLLGGLADNKKQMRDATVTALQMAVTLNKDGPETAPGDPLLLAVLVLPICEALINPIGRQELLTWLLAHGETIKVDCSDLAAPLVLALQDKTAAVRASAESLLVLLSARTIISRASMDKATRDLPPATKRGLLVPIEKITTAYGTKKTTAAALASSADPLASTAKVSEATEVAAAVASVVVAAEVVPAPVVATTVAAPKQPTVKTEASTISAVEETPSAQMGSPSGDKWKLKKTSKAKRLDEFFRLNWPVPPEEPGETELNALKATWDPLMTADLSALLFPVTKGGTLVNQDLLLPAVTELTAQLAGPHAQQHLDLILRWCAYALGVRESASGLLRILALVSDVFTSAKQSNAEGTILHDSEVLCILPHLIDKSGHKSERHKAAFKTAIAAAGEVVAPNKVNQHLLTGLTCKNKKTRVVCIEEMQRVVESAGAGSLGRAGVREIGLYLDSKDNDVSGRNACLELCFALYLSMGNDLGKLMKLLGDLSERSASMIDDRIKQKNRQGGATLRGSTTFSSSTSTSTATPERVRSRTPVKAASNSVQKKDEAREASPFRLEMTPPDEARQRKESKPVLVAASPHGQSRASALAAIALSLEDTAAGLAPTWTTTPAAARGGNGSLFANAEPNEASEESGNTWRDCGISPAPSTSIATTIASSTSADGKCAVSSDHSGASAELASIYAEVLSKINALLADNRSDMHENDPLHEQCTDYLKILHDMVNGEWSSEILPEDEALLRSQAEPLMIGVQKCLSRAFDQPAVLSPDTIGAHLCLDVSLASASLATIFVMVKRNDLVQQLSMSTVVAVLGESLRLLVDERITTSGSGADEDEPAVNIVRALNMVALRLSNELSSGAALSALLQVIGKCNPSSPVAKPASKLLLLVLAEEVKKPHPFAAPSVDAGGLLLVLNDFFHLCQQGRPADGSIAFSCGKTVLLQMVTALGIKPILALLDEAGIPLTSTVTKMAAKLADHMLAPDPVLQARVVSLIDDITTARDKTAPIRQLHALKQQHPTLDVNQYLQRISSAFRRFVLDTLAKLDGEVVADENAASSSAPSSSSSASASASASANSAFPTDEQPGEKDGEATSEAFRILDTIKSHAKEHATSRSSLKPLDNLPPASSSASAQIKGSLASTMEVPSDDADVSDMKTRLAKIRESMQTKK